jgi:hypothetical protein
MIYTDYQIAAAKHLNTCKSILDSIDRLMQMDNSALVVSRYKLESFHNIYYLSGYTLESIATYSIYKHFGWNINNSVKRYDRRFSNASQFDFFGADRFGNIRSFYSAKSHLFQTNQFEVLRREFGSSRIEFIDQSVAVNTNIRTLFNSWKAEVRYHKPRRPYINNNQLSENDVRTFVSITENIYNSLLQIVG